MDRFRMLPSYHYEDSTDGKLEKSVGKPLRNYKIEGNCIQNGTPTPEAPVEVECVGERTINLFNPEEVIAKFDSGDTYTNKSYICVFIQLKPNTTYYLKTFNPTGTTGQFYMANTEQVNKGMPGTISLLDDSGKAYPRGFEKTSTTDDTGRLYIGHYGLGTTDERSRILRENQIQVVEGSYTAETAPSYEPYGCKLPIITRGKNLIDFGEVLDKNLYIASQYGTGMTPSSTGGTWRHSGYTEVTEGMTYKFEANNRNASAAGHAWYDSSKTYISGISSTEANEQNGVLIAPEGACYVRLSWTIDEGYNPDYVNTVKFYEGNPITENIYLDEPLRKVRTDADYIEYRKKKAIRKTYVIDDSGTKTIDESIGILETPTETEIVLPEILTRKGFNEIAVGTTTQPSNITYQYYKGGK